VGVAAEGPHSAAGAEVAVAERHWTMTVAMRVAAVRLRRVP
jgi:hypothetical protein